MSIIKEHSVRTYVGANFDKADFKVVMPSSNPIAVLTLTPGSGGDGRHYVFDNFWTQWAKRMNVAILGIHLTDVVPKIDEDYVNAKMGSGQALNEALEVFKLSHLPLLMYGHSAGGGFNYEYACAYPEKVAAFIVNKGGVYYTALAPAATRTIPSIFFVGLKDAPYRVYILSGLYEMNMVVSEANHTKFNWDWKATVWGGHEIGASEKVSRDLFDKVLADRKLITITT